MITLPSSTLAASIVAIDGGGAVVQASSDQLNATARRPPPPPDRTIVPITIAVATDGGRPNKTAVADALAAASGVAVAALAPVTRADAGMPCPKRTCAAWAASLATGGNVTAARALRVGVDAGGPVAVALARAVAAATPNATAATLQYTAGLYGDDLAPPGLEDDDDDEDGDSIVPGRGRRLAPGAIVAIVAAAALLVASVAGMAGTVLVGCRRRRKAEDDERVERVEREARSNRGGEAAAASAAATRTAPPVAAAASPFGGDVPDHPRFNARPPPTASDTARRALSDAFDRTATV